MGSGSPTIRPFEPHPFLKNPHAMTIAAAFWRRQFELPAAEVRLFRVAEDSEIQGACHWQREDGGEGEELRSTLEKASGTRNKIDRARPVLVIVHGLEGSCDSNYVLGIAEQVWRRGFHVVRLNQRNCGGTEHLTPTLYNSGMSGDYRAVLEELAMVDGFTRIFFAGYSMGGNLVTKMAAELGKVDSGEEQNGKGSRALRGICAICPAIDLAACADALEKRENYFYQRRFVKGLMARYARKAALFPKIYSFPGDFGKVRTVRQFDDVITAPCFGFRDAQEYYESASARKVIANVRVPALMITAQDDPFVPYESFAAARATENPAIRFAAPRHGGHCGFISRHSGAERFWAEARIAEFCAEVCAREAVR
jgi:uncharacterized protein